jgi:regulator of cell morphogenesis and NO signaling
MESEEEQVFPSIRALTEDAGPAGGSSFDRTGLERMIEEHDEAGEALEQLRELTDGYTPPEDACPEFRAALNGLAELESNMHRHVHKENNILFPRARSLSQ